MKKKKNFLSIHQSKTGFFEKQTKIIELLCDKLKKRDVSLFVGAGISFHSGLPLAFQLIEEILDRLNFTHVAATDFNDLEISQNVPKGSIFLDLVKTEFLTQGGFLLNDKKIQFSKFKNLSNNIFDILSHKQKTLKNLIIETKFPFEDYIETLSEGSELRAIYDIFKIGEPNTNHIFIAKLAKHGLLNIVCTTNFDILIEKAFESEGMCKNKDYKVYFSDKDFQSIDWNDNFIKIIKIHGSCESYESMAITLKQVASRQLSEPRSKITEYLFSTGSHSTVLILGYSCSDVFDIMPQISELTHPTKEVLKINHFFDQTIQTEYETSPLSDELFFDRFTTSLNLTYNTDKLIEIIWKKTSLIGDYTNTINEMIEWIPFIDEWEECMLNIHHETSTLLLPALFLSKSSRYDLSLEFFKEIPPLVCLSDEARDKNYSAGIYANIGTCYRNLEKFEEAHKFFEISKRIYDECNNTLKGGTQIVQIGTVYLTQRKYQQALQYFQEALNIVELHQNKRRYVFLLNNLSITYYYIGNLDKAEYYLNETLALSTKNGFKDVEVSCLGNLGRIFQKRLQFDKAYNHYYKALIMAESIRNFSAVGYQYNNIGNIFFVKKEYDIAKEYFHQALSHAIQLKKKDLLISCNRNIGACYRMQQKTYEAKEYYQEAFNLSAHLFGDEHQQTKLLQNDIDTLPDLTSK